MPGRILVGTSSWADPGFVEDWYPRGLPARDRLAFYADRFEAVEVNASFYAVPEERTVRRWAEVTPDGFTFDFKLHRLLSRHSAQLESLPPAVRERARTTSRGRVVLDPAIEQAMVEETLAAIAPLEAAGRFGAFLLQLTPAFSPRDHRFDELEPLLAALAPRPVALELRHRGWVEGERAPETFDFLAAHRATFVGVDAPRDEHMTVMPPVDAVTNPRLAYLRAHGRNAEGYLTGRTVAERFGWEYTDAELEEIAGRARTLAEQADVVHVMFNNNRSANAPTSAGEFRRKLGQDPGPPACAGEQLELA
ncbi:MAG TPA: DUF72 domain-containing protein [Thermoleophilaceae bacterium]|nr:DUF72 domain-containing protein [Thermoleophilaceae bacterium]